MEAGNEEAIRGLLGALEAEPEMEILVLEMVNGGGGGWLSDQGWGGRVEYEEPARRMWVQPPPGGLWDKRCTVSLRHGDPPKRLPLGRGPSPRTVAGIEQTTAHSPGGACVSPAKHTGAACAQH